MATNSIAPSEVCRLQKSILDALSGLPGHFYLSDSSALCRFYLNHRITEELVFILDSGADFHGSIKLFTSRLANYFTLQQAFTSDSAAVVIVSADNIKVQLERQDHMEVLEVNIVLPDQRG